MQPTQGQMLFPMLEILADCGPMKAKQVSEALADRLQLPDDVRTQKISYSGGREANVLQRTVRWTRQTALLAGLLKPDSPRGIWEIAERGENALHLAKPGFVVCVAKSDSGALLWGQALSAMKYIEDESVQLVFTSPPYPLVVQREYGGWSQAQYVDTAVEHVLGMRSKLTPNGSIVLNLGDVYTEGQATLFPYQEELAVELRRQGLFLIGRELWHNPSKPKTTPYVTKQRTRMANSVETFWWWSPTPEPKANNRNILEPYSEKHLRTIAKGGELRRDSARMAGQSSPGLRYRTDNGGRIPFNCATVPHESSNSDYLRYCRANNFLPHPARMPAFFPRQWIRFATDIGDTVWDPFSGSLVTWQICEEEGRHFIGSEMCLDYVPGGLFRLRNAPGLTSCFHRREAA